MISVIMGTYNGRSRIDKAISSIKKQTYTDWELIICDDCSSDGTYEYLINKYKDEPKIIITQLQKNSGLSSALNRCIELSHGEYLARMDDDDYSHPDRLEKQLNMLIKHPEVVLVSCNINYFDDDGVFGCTNQCTIIRSKEDVYLGKTFVHPTVMIRKAAIVDVGCYTVSKLTFRGQDYDLWCKLYYAGYKGLVMHDILFDYYESRQSIKKRKFRYRLDHIRIKLAWRRKLALPLKYEFAICHDLAVLFLPEFIYIKLRKKYYSKLKQG